jgi:surface polysaccharide O-acyltransferase-like enzyme
MSKYLSDKLRTISFLLIVFVVFCHAHNLAFNFKSESVIVTQGFNSFIQEIISQGIAKVASPLFFIISGFVFFLNIKNGSFLEFFSKYRRRSKTLVLPYLLWSILGILFYLILQSIPFLKDFFTKQIIVDLSFSQLLSTILINPIPYQFWFIRDLVILIVLSPLIYWLIKHLNFYIVFILLVSWIYGFNFILFTSSALFFFGVGAIFSIKKINIQNLKLHNQYLLFLIIWITLIILKTTLIYMNFENEWLISVLHKISILIGIISIWFSYDHFLKKIDISKTKFYNLFQFTFFIYAFHEPVLTVFKKGF